MPSTTVLRIALCLGCATLGTGCRPSATTVSGVVTLDDKPLHRAGVLFFPAAGDARTAHAVTDASGRYTASVPATTLNVVISLHVYDGKEAAGEPYAEQVVPSVYSDPTQSTLRITPTAGQNTVADFALTSRPQPKR